MNDNEMFNPEKHGLNLKGSLIKILLKLNVKPSLANKLDDLDITDEVVNLMAPKIFPIDYDSPIANNINFLLKRIELVPNNYEVVDIIIHNKDKFIKENLSKLVNALYEHEDLFFKLLESDYSMIKHYTGTTLNYKYNELITKNDYFELPEVVRKDNFYLLIRYKNNPNFLNILRDYLKKSTIEKYYLEELFKLIKDKSIDGYEDIIDKFIELDKDKTMKFLLTSCKPDIIKKFIEKYKDNAEYVTRVIKEYPELLTIDLLSLIDYREKNEIINKYLKIKDVNNIDTEILTICDLSYDNLQEHKEKLLELVKSGKFKKGFLYDSFVSKNINEIDLNLVDFTSSLFLQIPTNQRENTIKKLIESNKIQSLSEDTLSAIVGDIIINNTGFYVSNVLPHEFYQSISKYENLRNCIISFEVDCKLIDYKIFEEDESIFYNLKQEVKEKIILCSIRDNIKLPYSIYKNYIDSYINEYGILDSSKIKSFHAKILKNYIESEQKTVRISSSIMENREIYETLKNSSAIDRIIVSFLGNEKDELKFEDYIKAENMMDIYVESLKPRINKNGEKKELSQLEAVMAAYKLSTHLGEYQFEEKGHSRLESRNFHFFLSDVSKKNPIVCAGYASFMDELLHRAGYDVSSEICVLAGEEPHARLIISIDDPKYGVKGVYTSDPTWSSISYNRLEGIEEHNFNQFLLTCNQSKEKESGLFGPNLENLIKYPINDVRLRDFFEKHGVTYKDYEEHSDEITEKLKLELLKALDYFVDKNKPEYQRGMENLDFDAEMNQKNVLNAKRTREEVIEILRNAKPYQTIVELLNESEYRLIGSWIKKEIFKDYDGWIGYINISSGYISIVLYDYKNLNIGELTSFLESQGIYTVEYNEEDEELHIKKGINLSNESLNSLYESCKNICSIVAQYQNNMSLENEEHSRTR